LVLNIFTNIFAIALVSVMNWKESKLKELLSQHFPEVLEKAAK
jgi:hypothetical protein